MANNISVEIKDLLVAANIGVYGASTGWSIHLGNMVDIPDTMVLVKRTGFWQPANPKWLIDYPSIQCIVRGAAGGYTAAESKIQDVKDALLGIPSQALSESDWLVQVNLRADIADIGLDKRNRPQFSINFALIVEPENVNTHRQPL